MTAPAGSPLRTVSWVQAGWDHYWASGLRGQMDAELGPRYRELLKQGRPRPLPPRAEDIETSARGLGVRELVLQTGILQPEAIALYSREGWERIPGFGPYASDDGSVCFRKQLR